MKTKFAYTPTNALFDDTLTNESYIFNTRKFEIIEC